MPYPTLPIYFTTFMTINGRLHLGEVVIQAKKFKIGLAIMAESMGSLLTP